MTKRWELTQENFNRLLQWLDPDREQAAKKYEIIRCRLIKIFTCRGCQEAEELADDTIDRVTRRVEEVAATYVGDPALYFYGVARNVYREYIRRQPATLFAPEPLYEQEFECLEHCLDQLTPQNQQVLLEYYQREKHEKREDRKELAKRLGISPNTLRLRLHRIRNGLQECIDKCLNGQLSHETDRARASYHNGRRLHARKRFSNESDNE